MVAAVTSGASRRLPWTVEYDWLVLPILLVVANALIWTAYATMGGVPNLHTDSLEAYVWGNEFQLGYYKQPAFYAWIAGAWFRFWPHTNWAFYLLSEANASFGVVGTWALLGRFTKGPERLAGTLLLLLTTFYTFNAFRFNANTMPLSLWPWTMYFFILSLEKKSLSSGIIFGFLAGISLLTKYYALLLLAACFFAALIHRDRRAYFRSWAPWIAIVVCCLVITPHLIWLGQHQFESVSYVLGKKGNPKAKFGDTWLGFAVVCLLYHALQLLVIAAVRFWDRAHGESASRFSLNYDTAFLAVLALTPLVLTLLAGAFGYLVTPLYVVPIFSLTPFLLLVTAGANPARVTRVTVATYGAIVVVCLISAPFQSHFRGLLKAPVLPLEQVSTRAVAEWKSATPAPLHIAAGSFPYSQALAFYAPGNVSEFSFFSFVDAPWITPDRIKREGLLVVCIAADTACRTKASQYETADTRITETNVSALRDRPPSLADPQFDIIVTPPAAQ